MKNVPYKEVLPLCNQKILAVRGFQHILLWVTKLGCSFSPSKTNVTFWPQCIEMHLHCLWFFIGCSSISEILKMMTAGTGTIWRFTVLFQFSPGR
jgi:hypothetical protein